MWWKFKRFALSILVRTSNRLFGKELIHRSSFAGMLNRIRIVFLEIVSPARRRQARFERENPDAPWFVPAAIPYIERHLRPDDKGFEWGCGRSTLWFAHRVGHITSIEGRRSWFEEISHTLDNNKLSTKITLRLAEVTTEHRFRPAEIERYAGAIDEIEDNSLNFIVVDGHFRESCLHRIGNKLQSGGLLIIDNSEVIQKPLLDSLNANSVHAWNNGIWETTVIHWH